MCHQHSFCLKGSSLWALLQEACEQGSGKKAWETSPGIYPWVGHHFLVKQRKTVSLGGHPLICLADKKALLPGWDIAAPGLQPLYITVRRGRQHLPRLQLELSSSLASAGGAQEWALGSKEWCERKAVFQLKSVRAAVSGSRSLRLPKTASDPVLRRNVCSTLGYFPSGEI